MSVTILEALQNAKTNLIENGNLPIGRMLGEQQLTNAITLLEKGYSIDDDVESLIDQYEDINSVPSKQ